MLVRTQVGVSPAVDADAYIELSKESSIKWEQRNYLLAAANELASYRATKEQQLQGLTLYEEFFAKYPNQKEVSAARVGYVNALLATKSADSALQKLQTLELATPGSLYVEPYLTICRSHEKARRYDKAIELLSGLLQRASDSFDLARILDKRANLQLQAGKKAESFESYQLAAKLWMDEMKVQKEIESTLEKLRNDLADAPLQERHHATSEWDQKLRDSFGRMVDLRAYCVDAVRVMGDHHLAANQYEESLGYWDLWHCDSTCGNGHGYWEGSRDLKMALCNLHLGQFDEATQSMETWFETGCNKGLFSKSKPAVDGRTFSASGSVRRLEGVCRKKRREIRHRHAKRVRLHEKAER